MNGRVLGIDFGTKFFGFAISDPLQVSVSLLPPCKAEDFDWYFLRLVELINIKKVVFGVPVNRDGTEGQTARAVRAFADNLVHNYHNLEFILVDEFGSSEKAKSLNLISINKEITRKLEYNLSQKPKNQELMVHSKSAAVILMEYLARQ
jgi:putative holliday junction resolvase